MQRLPTLSEIEAISPGIDAVVPPTPQFSWPLLNARAGCELWVKHENHTAIGAFKIRGALTYMDRLRAREPGVPGIVAATRGNFGQALAFAASRAGLASTIVVPHGNSAEKNRAMRGLGANVVEHGRDYQEALVHSGGIARESGFHWVPPYHRDLVCGNAVSALAFLRHAPALDSVYFPIGMGTGVCAMIAARDALGLRTRVVGVVSAAAPAMALSHAARGLVVHPVTTRIADGMACSTPDAGALEAVLAGVERIVTVSDDEVEAAMRAYFGDTHNVAEGAAGSGLAAVLQDRGALAGRRVGVVLTGGNVDSDTVARVLAGARGRS
jgi:threonine dehydratase